MGKATFLIGIDIGGTSVRAAIAPSDDLKVLQKVKQDTAKTDAEAISRQVIAMVEELMAKAKVTARDIKAISIATAGPIDAQKGEIFNNANLGFKVIPLRAPIARQFPATPSTSSTTAGAPSSASTALRLCPTKGTTWGT